MRKCFKIFSSLVLLTCLVFSIGNLNVQAMNDQNSLTEIWSERTDINFIEGTPGDTHLVYTYKENGNQYKVVEDTDIDFQNVNSTIYILNDEGNYIKEETLELNTLIDNTLILETTKSDGITQIDKINGNEEVITEILKPSKAKANDGTTGEWITVTSKSNTYIKNLTITGIIAALGAISSSVIGAPAASAFSAAASTYFNLKSPYAYYTEIYNYMLSSTHVFVIKRDASDITYYSDSARTKWIGHTYQSYDGR